jgi:hypothetical protein
VISLTFPALALIEMVNKIDPALRQGLRGDSLIVGAQGLADQA